MTLQAIKFDRTNLQILDQLRLPYEESYVSIKDPQGGWQAIKSMQVRGAPAIAIVAALSLAVKIAEIKNQSVSSSAAACLFVSQSLKFLTTSRPTAVNLLDAAKKLEEVASVAANEPQANSQSVFDRYLHAANKMLEDDRQDNQNIGRHGAEWIEGHTGKTPSKTQVSVITHCNTGSLATAGYGTALGVVRSLHARGSLNRVFYTETRPYNQGARLTGYELLHDKIPAELITDSMVSSLLSTRGQIENIAAVVVGADRVAANGDTANKIGTYSLAIQARFHGANFLVAAPRTTIDMDTPSGAHIIIEERPGREMITVRGLDTSATEPQGQLSKCMKEVFIAPRDTKGWNPAFDVTPAALIDGIVTEMGVIEKSDDGRFHFDSLFPNHKLSSTTSQHNGEPITSNGDTIAWGDVLKMKAEDVQPWSTWVSVWQ